MDNRPLVSVIMPAYNCVEFIKESIESVLNQTYTNLELVITDDCSTDATLEEIKKIHDPRIKLFKLDTNSGAAIARNNSIQKAQGDYLAFLDSDDIWKKEKLEKQISFMKENAYVFSSTAYGKIDEKGDILPNVINPLPEYNYNKILTSCPGNSTIIYDCKKIGKIYGPDIRKRNDFAMWLKVIKVAGKCYGYNQILGYHRIREGSISKNKTQLVKYQWQVYRKIEKIGIIRSLYLTTMKMVKGILKKNG